MKNIYSLLPLLLFSVLAIAQSPQSFNYQAIVRGVSGNALVDQTVGVQISILQGSAGGTAVYVERVTPTTNDYGLINIQVGTGEVQSGTFNTIDWANGPYFLKTEIDDTGGTTYTEMGTSQLISVPYALYAETVNTVNENQTIADVAALGNSVNTQLKDLTDPTDEQDAATKAYVDALQVRIEVLELLNNGFIDTRDGNQYNVVKIGNQIWLAENLRYLPSVVGPGLGSEVTPYYYVYDYDGTDINDAKTTTNYNTYGVLYNWPAAMDQAASSSSSPSGIQGVCPTGWHLPSNAEWTQLTDYLGGENIAGGKMKETATTHWASPNTGATNESGFTAFPGGVRTNIGSFSQISTYGYWWSATEYNSSSSLQRQMRHDLSSIVNSFMGYSKELGLSVRCVKDQ